MGCFDGRVRSVMDFCTLFQYRDTYVTLGWFCHGLSTNKCFADSIGMPMLYRSVSCQKVDISDGFVNAVSISILL